MVSSIFLIDKDNNLSKMEQSNYRSEDVLQKLLAHHPSLIGMATTDDQGLLLVRREQPVPEQEGGSERWSLDHLFLDRSGVPILVEVKRASDTRTRREVVAQMLDYAANGVAYWPIEGIIDAFRRTAVAEERDPDVRLAEFLGQTDAEAWWRQVDSNLRSGRIRMVFVADRIPKELRRIIEFLNEQMRPAEVLAIELEQFDNQNGFRTFVPRLIGATERAETAKTVSTPREPLSLQDWLQQLKDAKGDNILRGAEIIISFLRGKNLTLVVSDSHDSVITVAKYAHARPLYPFYIRRTGNFEISLEGLSRTQAYASEESRLQLLDFLRKSIPSLIAAEGKANGFPRVPLIRLLDDMTRKAVFDAIDGVVQNFEGLG